MGTRLCGKKDGYTGAKVQEAAPDAGEEGAAGRVVSAAGVACVVCVAAQVAQAACQHDGDAAGAVQLCGGGSWEGGAEAACQGVQPLAGRGGREAVRGERDCPDAADAQ